MRIWLFALALIFVGCTSTATIQPTLRGPVVPTRVIPTATPTLTPSNTPTVTPTFTSSPLPTLTPTDTATLTPTATLTTVPSSTPTLTPSSTAAFILTPSGTSTTAPSDTPTFTLMPSRTNVPSDTPTITLIPATTSTPGEAIPYRNSTSMEPAFIRDTVTLDTPLSGTTDDQHPAELYSFAGTAGTMIDVSMTAQSTSLDPYLLVLDPKGREISRDDDIDQDHHDAAIKALPIPETGTYVIVATRYGQDFGDSTGDFDLTVTTSAAGSTAAGLFSQGTGYNSLLSGMLSADNTEQIYTFRAAAGDVISIQLTKTSGDLDPNLSLTDNLGTTIALNDDNLLTDTFDSAIQGYIIQRSGYYSIIAARFSNSTDSGGYRLKLARDSQNASGVDALLDPINSTTISDAGTNYTDFSAGDILDSNNNEHSVQALITFRLPPNNDQPVQSAAFQMQPCLQRGGGFATLGALTIYQDSYGKIAQARNLTHPLPGARVLSTQNSCNPLDLTSLVQEAYASGTQDVQLRLLFRSRVDNGVQDEVSFTPNLLIMFGS